MSTTDYANQEALNKALNIYRTCMRGFIIFHLKKISGANVEDIVIESVSDWRADAIDSALNEGKDIKSIIDIDDFPLLVVGERGVNWRETFRDLLNDDKDFQNQLWLIKTCRDQSWAHPPDGDAESEGTRAYLFLIAEVLRKIKRSDKQREVETIRDELFFDDSAERFVKAEERLKYLESEKSEAEQRFADVESEKRKYEKNNTDLLQKVDEKEKQRKKLDRNLKNAKERNNKLKSDVAGVEKRLEKSEAAQADYKARLEATSKDLKWMEKERRASEKRLVDTSDQLAVAQAEKEAVAAQLRAVQNLFTVAATGERKVQEVFQSIYPPVETDSTVRILDRRGVNKKNYLLELLEQKQPTIIYVQSEEMVDLLLEGVIPEKADLIEKHGKETSEAEEAEILEKLENGELIAVVSDTTFSTLTSAHCVEHFVFCHLAPGLDEFFKRCEVAFISEKSNYLHLIYESKQDIEELAEKYPNEEELRKLYEKFKDRTPINGEFINSDNLHIELCKENELDMTTLGIKTGFSIFEELGFLEQNGKGIRRLSATRTRLEESKIYCIGKKLREEAENSPAFQYEQSIEQIWEGIQERLDVSSEQMLYEDDVDKTDFSISKTGDDLKPIETVENGSGPDEEDTEPAKEFNKKREKKLNIADRYVRETTEKDRNAIAVQVV